MSLTPNFNKNNRDLQPSKIDDKIRMVRPVEQFDKEIDLSTRKQTMNNVLFANEQIRRPRLKINRTGVPFFVTHAREERLHQQQVRKCSSEVNNQKTYAKTDFVKCLFA